MPYNQGRPPERQQTIGDKFSDLTLLLRATQPKGYTEYYNTRSPLVGKEVSLGSIDKTDMLANDMMVWAILEFFFEGQVDIAWDLMTWYQNDMKASMSIEGKLLDKITSQEIRYTTTQELHEFQHTADKKGRIMKPPGGK